MFDGLTMYFALGLFAGLAGFLFLFRKWDFPGWLKKTLRLYTRMKAIVTILVLGILLAILVTFVAAALQITGVAGEVLEGLAVGFNCAVLTGVIRPEIGKGTGGSTGSRQQNSRTSSSSGGRRSKG